jgi:hypothetical protein
MNLSPSRSRTMPRCPRRGFALTAALVVLGAGAGPARAQIGRGWTEFFPEKTVQLRGPGARHSVENGIETFSIQPGDERAETRVHDDHRTGTWQFEGWVNVEPGVEGGSVHQVFKFLMIVAYPDGAGELRQHSYQRLGATGIYNQWVRVNTIHDADAGRADVYINGTWRGMVRSASPGPNGWYHKYGIYNSSSTRPVVKWRDVRFWKDGTGDPSASAPDAGMGAADARPDATPVDTGAGPPASGGQGGTGGGPGGSGGADGSGGAGGGIGEGPPDAAVTTPPKPPGSTNAGGGAPAPPSGGAPNGFPGGGSGCACRLIDGHGDSAGRSGVVASLAFLPLAWLVSRRHRRRRPRAHAAPCLSGIKPEDQAS